jgi:hypothetical protein
MALLDFLQISPKSAIGDVEIMASLEEIYTDALQTTDHPVEQGADITDHSFKRPSEVVIRCGWSNSSFTALSGAVEALFSGGGLSAADYVSGVYSQLLALQQSRVPFDVLTNKRQYTNMLIQSLAVETDNKTSNALMVTATCKQIIIVNTQATTLPPREQQAEPAKTAEVQKTGVKQTKTRTPSPGGAVPPVKAGGGTFNGNGATGGW